MEDGRGEREEREGRERKGERGGREEKREAGEGRCQTHEILSVRLVDAILHGLVDELGVGRRLAESGGQDGESLQVENLAQSAGEKGLAKQIVASERELELRLTRSALEYDAGKTPLALAVDSSNRGTIAIALTSFAHPNLTK